MSRLRSVFNFTGVPPNKINCYFAVTSRFVSSGKTGDNHYEILEVKRDSSQSEIKDAYYKLSKQFHPDRNPGDEDASDKFRKLTEAYDILSNATFKKEYDQELVAKDAKAAPLNYRSSAFREINRNTDAPMNSENYTLFYKNRQTKSGRSPQVSSSSFNPPPPPDLMEEAVNPFNPIIEPQSPPINKPTKSYKYYSQDGWTDPGEGVKDSWELKGGIPIEVGVIIFITVVTACFYGFSDRFSRFKSRPKS